MRVGTAEGLCFDCGFLGDMRRLLQCLQDRLHERFQGTFEKSWRDQLLFATTFKRVWTLNGSKYDTPFTDGENKWEALEDLIQWAGHWSTH